MTSAAMRSSISLPRRWETSRTRSFSRRPLGPSVPLSWPPWPGSMTTRLILRPSARMREFCPELVWRAALAISSGAGGMAAGGAVTGGLAADVIGAGGAAPLCVDAGGAGLGLAGPSDAADFTLGGGGWMAMGGAEPSGAGEAADVSVGAEMEVRSEEHTSELQ